MLKIDRRELVFLIVVLLLCIFLRFYHLSEKPLLPDEWGVIIPRYDTMITSVKNFLLLPTQDYWDKNPKFNYIGPAAIVHINTGMHSVTTPLTGWLVSFGLMAFGKNALGARFMPNIFSILSIFLFYLIVRNAFSRKHAILSTLLLSFYSFYLTSIRNTPAFEPIVVFFFLLAAYFVLFWQKYRFWRIGWLASAALMLFSNFPKAILLLGIMFIWEIYVLYKNELNAIKFFNLTTFYTASFIPSILWGIIRANVYNLNPLWMFEHAFARIPYEPFRILELLYSYSSTKQGAFLIFLGIYGLFLYVLSLFAQKQEINNSSKLNTLLAIMFITIPVSLLLGRQPGAWSHSMTAIPIVFFASVALYKMLKDITEGKYFRYLGAFLANWFYILIVKNMGDLITEVPRTDSATISLYKQVFMQILNSRLVILEFSILFVFVTSSILIAKYGKVDAQLKSMLNASLAFTVLIFIVHTMYLVISDTI